MNVRVGSRVVLVLACLSACDAGDSPADGGARQDGGSTLDAGGGGGAHDAGRHDAGPNDAGTGADAGAGAACELPVLAREPGPALVDLDQLGSNACAGTSLGSAIEAVHAAHPELDDIRELYVPDPQRIGDQSFVYAFGTLDGGFALVFRRGGGDCPAGCTENEYYYFRTDDRCEPQSVGEFLPSWGASGCLEVRGFALWDHPPPPDPREVCGVHLHPGTVPLTEQTAHACGQRTPCSTKGGGDAPTALDFELRYAFERDASDASRATLTLLNTGHPALDGRPLPATHERGRVHVMLQLDNFPTTCPEQEEIEVLLDTQGHAESFVRYFEARTPDCEDAPGDLCKGGLDLALGNLGALQECTAELDLLELVAIERSRHAECSEDADCAAVFVDGDCITDCEVAVSASYADELSALIAQAGAALCADTTCVSGADCPTAEPACVEGACVMVEDGEI